MEKLTNQKIEEIVNNYKDSVYTKNGCLNLKTLKSIAKAAGVVDPMVYRDSCDYVYLSGACYDPWAANDPSEYYFEKKSENDKIGEVKSFLKTCEEILEAQVNWI